MRAVGFGVSHTSTPPGRSFADGEVEEAAEVGELEVLDHVDGGDGPQALVVDCGQVGETVALTTSSPAA